MSNPVEEIGQEPKGIMVVVEFDRSLLSHFNVSEWNAFVDDLLAKGLIPPAWSAGERPPAVSVMVDFSRLQRANYRLDGINLSLCWLSSANFTRASLRDAKLGCGRGTIYRGCRLEGASFEDMEISGCDFTDATGLEAAMFHGATYDPGNPPIGLPAGILDVCKAEADPPPANPRKASNPAGESYYTESPLRCTVTIQRVPTE